MPNHIIQCKNVACECHAQKTLMTHQQLVEEWKERVRKEWDQYGNGVFGKRLEDVLNFIEEAQLAAAKGAAARCDVRLLEREGEYGRLRRVAQTANGEIDRPLQI